MSTANPQDPIASNPLQCYPNSSFFQVYIFQEIPYQNSLFIIVTPTSLWSFVLNYHKTGGLYKPQSYSAFEKEMQLF